MAYLAQQSSNQRMATMTAVAALHAAALYAVVTGLASDAIPLIRETFIGVNIKQPKEPPPPPPPQEKQPEVQPFAKPIVLEPLPPLGGSPLPPLQLGPTSGELGAGGSDGGGIELLIQPTFEPKPLFTAKAPKARGSQANWVRQEDYPTRAITSGLEGLTKVRLTVGINGRVTDCAVTTTSGHDILDAASCEYLTKRARFDPATDTSGAKTDGVFTTSVRWQLPE